MLKAQEAKVTQEKVRKAFGNAAERRFVGLLFASLKVPPRLSTQVYAETYRVLTSGVSSVPGKMDFSLTPYMLRVMQVMDDPVWQTIVAMKSAQIGWTEMMNSYLCRLMHIDPKNVIIAFPTAAASKAYAKEKFRPMVKANRHLRKLWGDVDKCAFDSYQRADMFLKLVTLGGVHGSKSSVVPTVFIEEPDDAPVELSGQGATFEIIRQRSKSFADRLIVYGGTPTDGLSKVNAAYQQSNKMQYEVPCPKCQSINPLDFENLRWDKYLNGHRDNTFGFSNPDTARYFCPDCECAWDDEMKRKAVAEAINFGDLGWRATAESKVAGFAFNELLSSFPGSALITLAETKIKAEMALAAGKHALMKSFCNNSMGLPYTSSDIGISELQLKTERKDYELNIVPSGALVLTMGADIQKDRIAYIIRGWGRNGNSWLISCDEIWGDTSDRSDPVWEKLFQIFIADVPHAVTQEHSPTNLIVNSMSIDSGHGTQVVYRWVRDSSQRLREMPDGSARKIEAIKGASDSGVEKKAIRNPVNSPSANTKNRTVAQTMGVPVRILGTHTAKDEIMRKLALKGDTDRMFHPVDTRADYELQLLSNEKRVAPSGTGSFYKLVGAADEFLDCEMYCLHAAFSLNIQLYNAAEWDKIDSAIMLNFMGGTAGANTGTT